MVVIEFTFPGKRYHATPWGRHVNEGAVEWPPGPWRLLRALAATYWVKMDHLEEHRVRALLENMASSLPEYILPDTTGAHTRHYMPLYKAPDSSKIFDTFLHIEKGERILMGWPELELDDEQRTLLEQLLTALGYLGRAESWVEARLLPFGELCPEFTVRQLRDTESIPAEGWEVETVLCPMIPREYERWRNKSHKAEIDKGEEERLLFKQERAQKQGKDVGKVTLTSSEKTKIADKANRLFPPNLFDALLQDTTTLQKLGWSAPPGSRKIRYLRPSSSKKRLAQSQRRKMIEQPTVIRFALAPDTVQADTRPLVFNTLYLGEQLRHFIMGFSRRLAEEQGMNNPQCSSVFSGKDGEGKALEDDHSHAFFLPCDDDGDGRIDHLILYALRGFSIDEIIAASRLKNIWQHGGRPGLFAIYLGHGRARDYGGFKLREGQSPYLATSRRWRSATPYLPTRHPKQNRRGEPRVDARGNWIDGPEMQIKTELQNRGIQCDVKVTDYAPGNNPGEWRHFATHRKRGGGARYKGAPLGFSLEFTEPVTGPLALGYGCHFGLGLFVAEEE